MTGGMSSEEFQNYLGLLSRMLRLRTTEREAIEAELRSHLEERLAALTAEGIEPTRAISMALAEFGDAASLAAEFTAVSRFQKRRWIMRLSVGSIAASIIMAALLISYWPVGPMQLAQTMAQTQQAEKTQQTPSTVPEKLDVNAQTQAKLENLAEADFTETPLEQVMTYMADYCKVSYHFDGKVISEAGITSDTPVTFRMKNVPAEMILRLIFREIGLTYWLDNGVIIVSTPVEAENRLDTRVYRVDDIVPSRLAQKGETAANSGESVMEVDYDHLIDVITKTIYPNTWDINGGAGAIASYRGTLSISQTEKVHHQIKKLLNDLRQSINKEIVDDTSGMKRERMSGGMTGGRGGMGIGDGGMFAGKGSLDKKNAVPSVDGKKPDTGEQDKANRR